MKLRSIALFMFLAVAACGKSSDVPRLQEEALGLVQVYTPQIDALQRQVKQLDQRGQALGGAANSADAQRLWTEARAKVDQLRGLLQSMPAAVQAAAKTNNPEELEKLIDESRARIEADTTAAADQLDAVESWMWGAESARATPTPPAPTPPAPTPPPADTGTPPAAPVATDGTSPAPGAGSDTGHRPQ
jgi:hypothetical protein